LTCVPVGPEAVLSSSLPCLLPATRSISSCSVACLACAVTAVDVRYKLTPLRTGGVLVLAAYGYCFSFHQGAIWLLIAPFSKGPSMVSLVIFPASLFVHQCPSLGLISAKHPSKLGSSPNTRPVWFGTFVYHLRGCSKPLIS